MATWYACNSSVNIDSANLWNSAADGSGSWLTWASLGDADVLIMNGNTGIVINSDITCAELKATYYVSGVTDGGGCVVSEAHTITANLRAATNTHLIQTSGTGYTLTIIGNCVGSGTGTGCAVLVNSACTVDITGNVSTGNGRPGLRNASTGTTTINGNVTGSSYNDRFGAENTSTGTLNINGNCTGGSAAGSYAVRNTSTGTVNISGTVQPGSALNSQAVGNTSTGVVKITGIIINTKSSQAISGPFIYNPSDATKYIQNSYDTSDNSYKYAKEPAATDIKKDVVVGTVTGTYEGTGGSGGGSGIIRSNLNRTGVIQ